MILNQYENEIYNQDNELIDVVRHPLEVVKIKTDLVIKENSLMRLKIVDK